MTHFEIGLNFISLYNTNILYKLHKHLGVITTSIIQMGLRRKSNDLFSSVSYKKKVGSFLSYGIDPFSESDENNFDRVASPRIISVSLK